MPVSGDEGRTEGLSPDAEGCLGVLQVFYHALKAVVYPMDMHRGRGMRRHLRRGSVLILPVSGNVGQD